MAPPKALVLPAALVGVDIVPGDEKLMAGQEGGMEHRYHSCIFGSLRKC